MGKIRVKTLGDEEAEKEQQKEAQKRKDQKKTAKAPGMKGGERVRAVGPTEEEIDKMAVAPTQEEPKKEEKSAKSKKEKFQKAVKPKHSKNYAAKAALLDKSKKYALKEALELLEKLHLAKFDETVELHLNTNELGISGNMTLPHGSGKQTRVAIADDNLIDQVTKGKIDFDILLAAPLMMPKLAKVAKFLGPKGLMPNPKNGTVTNNPEETAKTFQAGMIRFKTESKAPVMHLSVGKLSFGEKKLTENIKTAFTAVQTQRVKKAVLKSTMSPAVKLDLSSL